MSKRNAKAEAAPVITSIKGFDRDLTCRGFQYDIGQRYSQAGTIKPCGNGFHACPETLDPLTVFQFYSPGTSRYCLVEQSGTVIHHDDKAASSEIFIRAEITVAQLVERAVEFRLKNAKGKKNTNSGPRGAASNSGPRGAASNSGTHGAASNSGPRGAASNSGPRGAASNSGYGGAASNSGTRGAASNSGYYGAAFSHAPNSRVMCEGDGQALYCTEFANDGSIASVASGITGRDGLKAGVWYTCKGGKLVEARS